MRKIDLSTRGAQFFGNVERMEALRDAAALEKSLERTVVAWLLDTGLWGAKFIVEVSPVVRDSAMLGVTVLAVVDVDGHPYLVETKKSDPAPVEVANQ